MGEVEPCGWFRNPLGGIAKKATLVSQIKKEGRKFLLLDTGNLLFRKPPQTETKRKDDLLRIDLLIQSYNEMGYDGVNVGEKDLTMGLKFLSEVSQRRSFLLSQPTLWTKKQESISLNLMSSKRSQGWGLESWDYWTINSIRPFRERSRT